MTSVGHDLNDSSAPVPSPSAANVVQTEKLFLLTWLLVVVMLTFVTLRLPLAFTLLFAIVDVALLLVLLGTANARGREWRTTPGPRYASPRLRRRAVRNSPVM